MSGGPVVHAVIPSLDSALIARKRAERALADAAQTETRLIEALAEAEKKAFDALARYKFQMFGYWAACWVHTNRVAGFHFPNPFKSLVEKARAGKL